MLRRAVDVDGAGHVVDAARRVGARVVHVSSVRVYDRPSEGVLDESTAAAPKGEDPSSDDKLEGEQIVLARGAQYGVPVVVIQPAIVYGPNAHYTLEMLNDLRTGRVILVNGGVGICNLVYVDDAVSALLLAATNDRAHGERFFISGPEHPTWAEFVGAFEAMLGVHRTVSLSERDALCLWQRSSGLRERLLAAGKGVMGALRAPVSAEDRSDNELPIKAFSPWVVKNRAREARDLDREGTPNPRIHAGLHPQPRHGPDTTVGAIGRPDSSRPSLSMAGIEASRDQLTSSFLFRYGWKLIATVMITGTATPLTRVGAYSHCLTASSAA